MKYKLIGIRPNHEQMKSMIGKNLYKTDLSKCYITGIQIGNNDKWEFVITGEQDFIENEPLFISVKSANRYNKQQKNKHL